LTCARGKNNYSAWNEMLVDTVGVKYGDIASILTTHEPWVCPPIGPADYIPPDLPAGI